MSEASNVAETHAPKRRMFGPQVPAEGDKGLYTQSWFPLCLSTDIPVGTVKGFDFLGGRVVVYRGASGDARVMSAYCSHFGADLSLGCVVGDRLQCAWHQWEYGADGYCKKTGIGDPAPPKASLFAFPSVEHYGLIWAFNGEKPLFDLPTFSRGDLVMKAHRFPFDMPVDPWIVCAQTPDIQHLKLLHKFELIGPDPSDHVEWTDFSMMFPLHVRTRGREMNVRGGIFGTTIFTASGTLDGRWFGFLTGMNLPRPSQSTVYAVLATERRGDDEEAIGWLNELMAFESSIAIEDMEIAKTMHFRAGSLTRADAVMAKFLTRMRDYPRAHPSAEFIS